MNNQCTAKFISIEGIDGCGKSTIINFLTKYFKEKNINFIVTKEPYGKIRELVLNNNNLSIYEIAQLFAKNRNEHIKELIVPNLKNNTFVLCDRYIDSSIAYQSFAQGLKIDKIIELNSLAFEHLPDLTIWLDVDVNIAKQRIEKRNEDKNSFDNESLSFFNKIKNGYEYIYTHLNKNNRVIKVDANQDLLDVISKVKNIINKRILNEN